MRSRSQPDPLVVLVVSSDPVFRRLAGASLSRSGFEVHTTTASAPRVERLMRLRLPQVVLLDVQAGFATVELERLRSDPNDPAIILIADDPAPDELDKWGALDALVARVRHAAETRSALHVVVGDT